MVKLLIAFTLISSVCYSQSRKEQIEILETRVDSLKTSLSETKVNLDEAYKINDSNKKKIDELNKEIEALSSKIIEFQDTVVTANEQILTLQKEKEVLEKSNQECLEATDRLKSSIENSIAENYYPGIRNYLDSQQHSRDLDHDSSTLSTLEEIKNDILTLSFTERCSQFVDDASENSLGIINMMTKEEFQAKWKKIYDVNYASFTHPWMMGNGLPLCHKIEGISYLGKLHGGFYFEVNLSQGYQDCGEQTFTRVIKVIHQNGDYFIDNFISVREDWGR